MGLSTVRAIARSWLALSTLLRSRRWAREIYGETTSKSAGETFVAPSHSAIRLLGRNNEAIALNLRASKDPPTKSGSIELEVAIIMANEVRSLE